MNVGRGFGAPGEALLIEHPFLSTLSGQTSPCTVSELGGLNLSYLWAEKEMPLAVGARTDVKGRGQGKLLLRAAHEGWMPLVIHWDVVIILTALGTEYCLPSTSLSESLCH